ncbi:MAG: DUF1835 domain-containing protein, partial [Gammaproteobacteria bacterium]|nr:DUF1835 domain-containing protein [Gammaproteobacteria bacterium]
TLFRSKAIAEFKNRHPLAKDPNYKPSLLHARMLVSSEGTIVKRLSLEKLKKEAKDLLKEIKSGEKEALERVEQHYHKTTEQYQLADTQLIIARENGLPSWPKLKAHIEQVNQASTKMGKTRPDQDLKTLHIRCGTDIQEPLKACGFTGDYLEISNPFPQGPVPHYEPVEAFIETRARFIRENYGKDMPSDVAKERIDNTEKEIENVEQVLRTLPKKYQRVVLWFEHDPFDQLCKAYVCAHLAELDLKDTKVECIQIDHFPGVKKFIGIGQLSQTPEVLLTLWPQRHTLTPAMIAYGSRIWQGFVNDDPTSLWHLTQEKESPLPHMQAAAKRMLMELPWTGNGLGLTEHLVLSVLAEHGPMRPGAIFNILTTELEPLPYLGDIMLLTVLRPLFENEPASIEVIEFFPNEHPMRSMRLAISKLGIRLLRGELNLMAVGNSRYVRELGGVRIKAGEKNWVWSNELQRPICL